MKNEFCVDYYDDGDPKPWQFTLPWVELCGNGETVSAAARDWMRQARTLAKRLKKKCDELEQADLDKETKDENGVSK